MVLRPSLLILLAFACAALAVGATAPGSALGHPSDSVADQDHDGVNDPPVGTDNCAGEDAAFNPAQTDLDGDRKGDACDTDDDGDSVDDALDNCRVIPNQGQSDIDGDNSGDACDSDDDGDGFSDSRDNCQAAPNPGQEDGDGDGVGDVCDDAAPGAPGPGGAPPVSAPDSVPDSAAPEVALRLRSEHRTAELGAGLAVPVSCSEGCTLSSRLRLGARDAARLGVGRVLGSGDAALAAAGRTFVFLNLSRRALRKIRGAGRVSAVLRVEAVDAAGNRTDITRRLTIRR